MSKKLLVVFVTILAGLFVASSAMADLPNESLFILQHYGSVVSGNSAATILNPEGKGDVLIYPYYDVREINGKTQDFYFFIINNSDFDFCAGIATTSQCFDGVAAKLRFREWDKSEEVFDVDIWLSRDDVWVGVVTHNTAIPLPYGARILSPDWVIIANDGNNLTLDKPLAAGFDFPTNAYIPGPSNFASIPPGPVNYPAPLSVSSPGSSNLMGYIEVIGEERTYDKVWTNNPSFKVSRITPTGPGTKINGTAGVPNELMGFGYLVRVADGQSMAYNAYAIANFQGGVAADYTLFQFPGSPGPQLTDAEDFLESIEFQIAKTEVFHAYSVESVIGGQSSLIVTFPTKHYHFCVKPNYTAIGVLGTPATCNAGWPVTAPWTATDTAVGSHNANTPESFLISIYDRNEAVLNPPQCFISPCPPGSVQGLPYEVNVIGFYQGSAPAPLLPGNRNNVTVSTGTFDSGWAALTFPNGSFSVILGAFFNFGVFYDAYLGLPGFALSLQEYNNNNVGGWYGDIRPAWYNTQWIGRRFPLNVVP